MEIPRAVIGTLIFLFFVSMGFVIHTIVVDGYVKPTFDSFHPENYTSGELKDDWIENSDRLAGSKWTLYGVLFFSAFVFLVFFLFYKREETTVFG